MNTWRLVIGFALLALVAVPVLLPFLDAIVFLAGSGISFDAERMTLLAGNTLLLAGGTLLVSLSLGLGLALVLFRTNLPGRRIFLFVIALSIFIPAPVFVSSWQAVLGTGDWLPVILFPPRPGQPWAKGLFPSIWVQSLVSTPWIVLILGHALLRVDRTLEEEALLAGSALRTILLVTLPSCLPAFLVAALWTAIQASADINVTDMFMFRTYAEEVYLVFSQSGSDAVPSAVLVSLPFTMLFGILLFTAAWRYFGRYPAIGTSGTPLTFRWGNYKWPACLMVTTLVLFFFGVPLSALCYQGGLHQAPMVWSGQFLLDGLFDAFILNGSEYFYSLWWAIEAAVIATLLAFLACWSIRWSGRRERIWPLVILALVCAAWVTPATVIGQGLHRFIFYHVAYPFPDSWAARVLYYDPSSLPLIWGYVIRIFPFCTAVLWPAFRAVPQPLCDAAKLEGVSNSQSVIHFFMPLTRTALIASVLVGIALSLAEIGTSKSAMTPGIETFTLHVFDRMHYGVKSEVSALCLVMILLIAFIGIECAGRYRCCRTRPIR